MLIDVEAAKRKPISQLTTEERMAIWESERIAAEREQARKRNSAAPHADALAWSDPATPANAKTAKKISTEIALSRIVTAQQILSTEYPEPKWAVRGLIPEGVTFIAGPPKLGKSIFALNIAVAVAEGGKALSQFEVERGSVLYLALEDGPRRIQERLRKLTNGRISERLEVVTEWPRINQGGIEAIDAWIQSRKDARLLIVDTLKMLRPLATGRDRNAYDADYEAIQPLTKLASQRVALVVVHHTRKALADDPLATVSGSYGLTGAADGVLVLSRPRNRSEATLNVIGRDVEEQELALEFQPNLCLWSVLGKKDEIQRSNERQEILDLLRETGELMTPGKIAELLDKPAGAIRALLFRLKGAGEVRLFGNRYQLPDYRPPELAKIRQSTKRKNVTALLAENDASNARISNGDNELAEKRYCVTAPQQDAVSNSGNAVTNSPQLLHPNDIHALPAENGAGNASNAGNAETWPHDDSKTYAPENAECAESAKDENALSAQVAQPTRGKSAKSASVIGVAQVALSSKLNGIHDLPKSAESAAPIEGCTSCTLDDDAEVF